MNITIKDIHLLPEIITLLKCSVSKINSAIKEKYVNDKSVLQLIKVVESSNKNRKGVNGYIDLMLRSIQNRGKKAGAFTDESARISQIKDAICNKTELGIKMIDAYYKKFNLIIDHVEVAGGKQDHYDLLIYHTDGTTKKCEEKGTKYYCDTIDSSTPPHENSVQIYNGPAKHFSISRKYLECWYKCNVDNESVKAEFNLPEIPSFDDWLEGSPYCMLDPKTEYSKTLKKNYREKYGAKTSMNGFSHDNPIDYRVKVNEMFTLSEEDKAILIKEVQEKYNNVLNEKEVWLQTTGILEESENEKENNNCLFSFCWYPAIIPKTIKDVVLQKKKDIEFRFIFEDNTTFTGIMRWGKGCGFSCFRMDFK